MINNVIPRLLYTLFFPIAMGAVFAGCGVQEPNPANGEDAEGAQDSVSCRTVLTVAVSDSNQGFAAAVEAFNEKSETILVEVKEYGREALEEFSENSLDAFSTELTMAILSGDGPDLVEWGYQYSPAYASGRLMENLYPYMEEDEAFHREAYYENILEAFELDNGLYVMPTSFDVRTMCGKESELGSGRGIIQSWEMGEMIEAFENSAHAEWLTANHSKELVLGEICYGCMGNFVDWETGECSFTTPEFVELLKFADTCPEQLLIANDFSLRESLRSGQTFLQPVILTNAWKIANMRVSCGEEAVLWPGYPVADGEKALGGGIADIYGYGLSICTGSSHKEEAWEFIKSFLTVEAQREEAGIPLLKSVSEERIAEALTPEYEGADGEKQEKVRYEIIYEGEERIGLTTITEEDAEIFRSIIENTHRSYGSEPGLYQIIEEEASAYFGKGKDAAAVAGIIQNRVSVYVEERMK